jgi:hypothetical protein
MSHEDKLDMLSIYGRCETIEINPDTLTIICDDFTNTDFIKSELEKLDNEKIIQSDFNFGVKVTKELCIKVYDYFAKNCKNLNTFHKIYFVDKQMECFVILQKQDLSSLTKYSQFAISVINYELLER